MIRAIFCAVFATMTLTTLANAQEGLASGRWAVKETSRQWRTEAATPPANSVPQVNEWFVCIPAEKAADPKAYFAGLSDEGDCEPPIVTAEGGKVTLVTQCSPSFGGTGSIEFTGTYSATTYTIDGQMRFQHKDGHMNVHALTEARYQGDCTGDESPQ